MVDQCATCRFRRTVVEVDECRRYPPSGRGFPEIKADDWCGEYQPRPPQALTVGRRGPNIVAPAVVDRTYVKDRP